jgi:MAE_28990/MAE_18760-like HEPN
MSVIDLISKDIDWRMSELGSLKSIPVRYKLLSHHKEMIIKYTIPSIYALWEGFVRNSFRCYITNINSLNLSIYDVHMNLVVHGMTSVPKLRLENARNSFKIKKEFTETYLSIIGKPFQLTDVIPTRSNVNFDTINEILLIFNLEELPKSFDKPLEKLVNFRNSIAHGEISIPIKLSDVEFFTKLLNDLMIEIFLRIEKGLKLETYKVS